MVIMDLEIIDVVAANAEVVNKYFKRFPRESFLIYIAIDS